MRLDWTTWLLVLGLALNGYKLLIGFDTPYYIFPWMSHETAQVAKSSPLLLWLHIATALVHFMAAYARCHINTTRTMKVALISQMIFTLILLPNIFHLGKLHPLLAGIANASILTLLWVTFLHKEYRRYFLILSITTIIEIIALATFIMSWCFTSKVTYPHHQS